MSKKHLVSVTSDNLFRTQLWKLNVMGRNNYLPRERNLTYRLNPLVAISDYFIMFENVNG
jgi:hypothetical protein